MMNVSHPSDANRSSNNPYQNPDLAAWLGSFEGVPDAGPATTWADFEPAVGGAVRRRALGVLEWLGEMLPGAALALILAVFGTVVAKWIGVDLLGYQTTPISPILLAILTGLIIRNTIGLPDTYGQGLRLCVKKILRIAIGLLGIRMSFVAASQIGLAGIPVVVGCMAAALIGVTWINRRLGLPRRLGSLIAVGTSICGVSAIVATSPVIEAEDDETSYAVATIALFGMTALFIYPFVAHWIFSDNPTLAGMFLGTAIHDTSQAAGAGLTYQQQFHSEAALNSAVVTKLLRNVFMVGVIPMMGLLYHRGNQAQGSTSTRPKWTQMVPIFVIGFLAMTVLRTIGDLGDRPFGILREQTWGALIGETKLAAEWGLTIAMGAVGLNTNLSRLKDLGWKPFIVGFVAAILVGVVSVLLLVSLSPLIG